MPLIYNIANSRQVKYQKVVFKYVVHICCAYKWSHIYIAMLTSEQEADSEFIPRNHLDFANLLALHLVEKKLQAKHRVKIPPMLSFPSMNTVNSCMISHPIAQRILSL